MDLKSELTTISGKINAILSSFFTSQQNEAAAVHSSVGQSVSFLEEFSKRGGKSLRSFLTVIGYRLCGGTNEDIYIAAASVELHHKHILILDDIADRDESRYGGKTLHVRYQEVFGTSSDGQHRALSFAMLDGVLLGAMSKELLLSTSFDPKLLLDVIHIFDTIMYRDTLAGWQIHGLQAIKPMTESTEEEFIKGLKLVTASYTFEGPLRIGLTLGHNTDRTLEHTLIAYAEYVGTAFQIHDDILGLFGDPKITGKPVGNDVREGKKTLLLQYAYAHAGKDDTQFIEKMTGTALGAKDLKRVQQIVKDTGSLAHSQELEKQFVQKGVDALSSLPNLNEKRILIELAHYIISREK